MKKSADDEHLAAGGTSKRGVVSFPILIETHRIPIYRPRGHQMPPIQTHANADRAITDARFDSDPQAGMLKSWPRLAAMLRTNSQ
jgi:hypothetical protein